MVINQVNDITACSRNYLFPSLSHSYFQDVQGMGDS